MAMALPARAPADEWRDGCPAGYRADYHRDLRLGAAAETESALTASRLLVAFDPSYHTSQNGLARSTTYDGSAHLQQRVWEGLTIGATASYLYHLEGPTRSRWPGTAVGSIGWRYDFEGELPPEKVAATQGASVRRAFVVQAIAGSGGTPSASNGVDAYRREAAMRAFDGYLLASSVLGFLGELRFEQVGCHAVFAHLRGGALWTGLGDASSGAASPVGVEEPVLTVPVTLAVGAYFADHVALIGEYGVALQRPEDVPRYASTQRLRVVIDYAADWGSFGFHIDFASNTNGLVGGGYLAVNNPWTR
jgi:hypothetical protein